VNETEAYRLEALIELAQAFPDALTAREVARRRHVPARFLSRLVGELAHEDLVLTTRGPHGGVRLAAAPAEIDLGSLVREPPPPSAGGAGVRWLATRLAEAQARALENLSLAALVTAEREATAATDFSI
jgi:DNA-binding IscR family transcriptional regulator